MRSPVERFLAIEASSGILLLLAAFAAIVWANSPWRGLYQALWHTPVGLRLGGLIFERDLHFVINDGLMVVFFFVVGLEIRRELHAGELSEVRRAALPAFAALGGMIAPALIYLAWNGTGPARSGWGIPTATDIAFAVGVLALLGPRVRPALRILLLALAVIDDVGAIVIIAVFYSGAIAPLGLALMGLGVGLILFLQKVGVRATFAYLVAGVVVWAGCLVTGVHPTLAGVVVGLLTPVHAWLGRGELVRHANDTADRVRERPETSDSALLDQLRGLDLARRESIAPVERLQHALHGWVAYAIMPLFALANAGVELGAVDTSGEHLRVMIGVVLGLALGKPLGIVALSFLAVRVGVAALPAGVSFRDVAVVGLVAGVGFTMAIFIASLAFPGGDHLELAKLGVLVGSTISAVVGLAAGRLVLPAHTPPDAASTDEEAERSTSA